MNEKIYRIVSNVMNIPLKDIDDDSSPDTIAVWDSLHHMNLILALEEEFSCHFSEEQIVEMMNVKLISLIVEELMNEKKRN